PRPPPLGGRIALDLPYRPRGNRGAGRLRRPGPPRAPSARLVPAPTTSEAAARHHAEQEDDDRRAEDGREHRDAGERQLGSQDDVQDIHHQPGANQPGDDRANESAGHAPTDQAFPDETRDG